MTITQIRKVFIVLKGLIILYNSFLKKISKLLAKLIKAES